MCRAVAVLTSTSPNVLRKPFTACTYVCTNCHAILCRMHEMLWSFEQCGLNFHKTSMIMECAMQARVVIADLFIKGASQVMLGGDPVQLCQILGSCCHMRVIWAKALLCLVQCKL